jgi:hypothetical protein
MEGVLKEFYVVMDFRQRMHDDSGKFSWCYTVLALIRNSEFRTECSAGGDLAIEPSERAASFGMDSFFRNGDVPEMMMNCIVAVGVSLPTERIVKKPIIPVQFRLGRFCVPNGFVACYS